MVKRVDGRETLLGKALKNQKNQEKLRKFQKAISASCLIAWGVGGGGGGKGGGGD